MMLAILFLSAFCGPAMSTPPLQIEDIYQFYDHKLPKSPKITEIKPKDLLPPSLRPENYVIKLQPILYPEGSPDEWTAPGFVQITATGLSSVNKIVIHRHPDLTIDETSIKLTDESNSSLKVDSVEKENESHRYSILLNSTLAVGKKYVLSMKYVVDINNGSTGLGFYRAFYTNEHGVIKRLATTQFMEYGARKAFPCFDEPSFKSTFTISLARRLEDAGYITLTNSVLKQNGSGVKDPDLPEGWVYDQYEDTVPMATYPVAFVISDYVFTEATEGLYSKPVRVYGPAYLIKGKNGGQFAADASAKVMAKLEELFELPYAMPKIDSVAIPREHFGPGAMENWGLIIYKDNYLMYYNGESVEANRQQTARVIVHEQTHQWFGNLATIQSWSHIWLSEGFATYFAAVGLNEVYPEFDQRREFLVASVQRSMAFDVGPNEPIVNLAAEPDKITSSTIIIYDKAASIIRMMEGFLGNQTLLTSLRAYLQEYKIKSAQQDDLFAVMNNYTHDKIPENKSFKDVMHPWTTQPGFPLIRVSKIGDDHVYISQERFLPATDASPQAGFWEIPIPIVTEDSLEFSNHTPTIWLSKEKLGTSYEHDTSKWILLNPDAFGYYRVLYDNGLLQLLQNELTKNGSKISGMSKSQLIDDYFSFAHLGHVPISTALELASFMDNETDFVVWYALFNGLQRALQMFSNEDPTSFKKYLAPKLDSVLNLISWNQGSDKGTKVIFRTKLADWACALESNGCIRTALELFEKWQSGGNGANPVELDLQPVLYCAIVAHGGDAAFELIFQEFEKTETIASQKEILLKSLACSKNMMLLNRLLNLALDSASELSKSTASIFQNVAANSFGRGIVRNSIRTRFEEIKAHTKGVVAFRDIVSTLCLYLTKETEKNDIEILLEERKEELSTIHDSLATSLDRIKSNIAWISQFYIPMSTWFEQHAL